MQGKLVFCPNCGTGLTVGEQLGGKIALGLVGLTLTKVDPWVGLVASVLGIYLGHVYVDSAIRTCPQCGQLINVANALA